MKRPHPKVPVIIIYTIQLISRLTVYIYMLDRRILALLLMLIAIIKVRNRVLIKPIVGLVILKI